MFAAVSEVPVRGATVKLPIRRGRLGVEIGVELDERELTRRKGLGSQAILALDLLNVLVTMPRGECVPKDQFSQYDWQRLRGGTRVGAVEIATLRGVVTATRLAAPPLTVRHASIHGRRWRTAVAEASRFAPYCSREVVLDRLPADELELRLEVEYLGIGVRVRGPGSGGDGQRLVEPSPFTPTHYSGASWLFAERMMAHHSQEAPVGVNSR